MLGVGLAMDAFSVSMANGMNEKKMAISRMIQIAIVFAGFQFFNANDWMVCGTHSLFCFYNLYGCCTMDCLDLTTFISVVE